MHKKHFHHFHRDARLDVGHWWMKTLRLLIVLALCLRLAPSPSLWAADFAPSTIVHFGGAGADDALAVAQDSSGYIFVTGSFSGTVPGPMNLGGNTLTSAGGEDIYLAKFSPSGAPVWSKRFGGTGDDHARGLAVDTHGNIVIVGEFVNTINFGGTDLVSAGAREIFVAKFSTDGDPLWSERFGGTGDDLAYAVACDLSGNVSLTGVFQGSIDFGGGLLTTNYGLTSFVAKLNSDGRHVWSKNFKATSSNIGYGIAADSNGNVAVAGAFQGSIDFGGGRRDATGTQGGYDVFVYSLSGTTGGYRWDKTFGGDLHDYGYGVSFDGKNDLVMTGNFVGTMSIDGNSVVSHGNTDAFVAKFTGAGVFQWCKAIGSPMSDYGYSVVANKVSNDVIAGGGFAATADFSGVTLTSSGLADMFIAKYSSSGTLLSAQRGGGSGSEVLNALSVNSASGEVIAAGRFELGSFVLGSETLTTAGYTDCLVFKVRP